MRTVGAHGGVPRAYGRTPLQGMRPSIDEAALTIRAGFTQSGGRKAVCLIRSFIRRCSH